MAKSETLITRYVFSAIVLFPTVILAISGWGEFQNSRKVAAIDEWPLVPCVIEETGVVRSGEFGSPRFSVQVRYRVTAPGQERTGDLLWWGYNGHLERSEAEALARSLTETPQQQCRINPDVADEAVLMSAPWSWERLNFMYGMLGVAGVCLALIWLWPARKPGQVPTELPRFIPWTLLAMLIVFMLSITLAALYGTLRFTSEATFGWLWTGDYEEVTCVVQRVRHVELITVPDAVQIEFAFQSPDGRSWRSNRAGLNGDPHISNEGDLARGSQARCFYPPGDPEAAFIHAGQGEAWRLAFGCGVLFLFLVLFCGWAVYYQRAISKKNLS